MPATQVVMADGSVKAIGEVRVGDKVLATDPVTGETSSQSVAATIIGEGLKQLVDVGVAGKTVTATTGHPFWVVNRHEWVQAGDLVVGDQLRLPNGSLALVASIRTWTALTRVNNLGVTGLHTYYVRAGGGTDVLVHNCGAAKAADDILPTPQVGSQGLQNHIDALYKGTTNPNRVGNGTTMDAIRNERATGIQTAGRMHSTKGQERLTGLNKWLSRNPDAAYQDRLVARSLADELGLVLGGWRMSAETVAAVGALIYSNRELLPVLKEHLEDNGGEILPTVLLDDVVRWLVAHRTSHPEVCQSVLGWLEQELADGTEAVRGLITVSGIVMIPDPGQPGAELRDLLGPRLRSVDPWLA